MKTFEISNAISGAMLGVYHAESKEAVLDAMARDAGYANYEEAQSVAPADPGEVLVTEIDAD